MPSYEAIIETSGKQFAVSTGDVLPIPRLAGAVGDKINFDHVLVVRNGDKTSTGAPHVAGAKVAAEIVAQDREASLVVYKHRRRHNSRKRNGHRQERTRVRITGVHA